MYFFEQNFFFCILLQLILNNDLIAASFEKCENESPESKIVPTLNGKVMGECHNVPVSYSNNSTINYKVFSWLSIPYAEPPTNQRRFMKPVPGQNWNDTRDATVWPKSCIQSSYIQAPDLFSEDCLYLNVFVRKDSFLEKYSTKIPIMIYIHGGGFMVGGSSMDLLDPSTLVSMSNIIVVTINYRLNAFGFMHFSDSEITGNQGLLDQSMAFKWVYENVEEFGGDKSKITITGESAGAWSVGLHLFYPNSWPYFRNGIMQSGGPTGSNNYYLMYTSSEATDNTINLMNAVGCNKTSNNDRVKCLQKVDPIRILANMSSTFERPIIDKVMFKKTIDDLAKENLFKNCNIITGYNSDEMGYFISETIPPNLFKIMDGNFFIQGLTGFLNSRYPYNKLNVDSILLEYFGTSQILTLNQSTINYPKTLLNILADLVFVGQSFKMAEIISRSGNNAYTYEYKYRIDTSPYDPIYGMAVHTEDIPIVFAEPLSNKIAPLLNENLFKNPYSASRFNYSLEAKLFTEKMISYWVDFITHDNPSFSKEKNSQDYWKKFVDDTTNLNEMTAEEKMNSGRYLLIQEANTTMMTGFSSDKISFWNYTYDSSSANSNIMSCCLFITYSFSTLVSFFLFYHQ